MEKEDGTIGGFCPNCLAMAAAMALVDCFNLWANGPMVFHHVDPSDSVTSAAIIQLTYQNALECQNSAPQRGKPSRFRVSHAQNVFHNQLALGNQPLSTGQQDSATVTTGSVVTLAQQGCSTVCDLGYDLPDTS